MMKKVLAWLLAAVMIFSLAACASKETPDAASTSEDTQQSDEVAEQTPGKTDENEQPDTEPDAEKPDASSDDQTPDTQPEDETPGDEEKPEEPAQNEEPDTQPTDTQPNAEEPSDDELMVDPPAEQSVDLAAVRTDILSQLGITDSLPLETDALLNLYGIDAALVAQSASFVTMSGTFPDEVILVEAVDASAAATIQEKLQNRLNEVLVQSENYDADNYKAAQSCQVRVSGLYVSLILSPKQADMAAIYATYVS